MKNFLIVYLLVGILTAGFARFFLAEKYLEDVGKNKDEASKDVFAIMLGVLWPIWFVLRVLTLIINRR